MFRVKLDVPASPDGWSLTLKQLAGAGSLDRGIKGVESALGVAQAAGGPVDPFPGCLCSRDPSFGPVRPST